MARKLVLDVLSVSAGERQSSEILSVSSHVLGKRGSAWRRLACSSLFSRTEREKF
jgi:hypothetical protein